MSKGRVSRAAEARLQGVFQGKHGGGSAAWGYGTSEASQGVIFSACHGRPCPMSPIQFPTSPALGHRQTLLPILSASCQERRGPESQQPGGSHYPARQRPWAPARAPPRPGVEHSALPQTFSRELYQKILTLQSRLCCFLSNISHHVF